MLELVEEKKGARTHLSNVLQLAVRLQLVDSVALGLAVGAALGHGTLATTAPNADAVDDVALLRAVAQPARLVRTTGPGTTVQLGELTVLPDADAQQVAHHLALLLPVQLLYVTVRTHLGGG